MHFPRIGRSGSHRPAAMAVLSRLLTVGIFALAGLLFWISFNTAQGTNLRTDDSLLRLSDLIKERSRHNAEVEAELSGVRDDVAKLARDEADAGPDGAGAGPQADPGAGTAAVTGAALTVTLTDAPPDATPLVPDVPDPQPNDLVVHQQDLQAVVNALWRGGAKAIQVVDQRLISTSAVRCVGNTLILQGRVYSPPYSVTAIGDQNRLRAALDDDHDIQSYLGYVEAYGLGWKVEKKRKVTIAGYSGAVDLHYAQPMP